MSVAELLKSHRDDILRIAASHGASNIRIFGSVARDEDDEKSDIDFLVEMEPGRSLLDRAALMVDLEELLGQKVDIATERALKERIKAYVLRDAVPL